MDGAVNTVRNLANKSISPWQGEMTKHVKY